MKSIHVLIAMLSLCLVSCKKEELEINQKNLMTSGVHLKNIKVFNAVDPICEMETADYLKDTINYKNEIYGFCSESCKNTFKNDTEKYVKK